MPRGPFRTLRADIFLHQATVTTRPKVVYLTLRRALAQVPLGKGPTNGEEKKQKGEAKCQIRYCLA